VGQENLGIGIVTQAQFIRDTLALLDTPGRPAATPSLVIAGSAHEAVSGADAARAVSATSQAQEP
jgi:hypothetical protein